MGKDLNHYFIKRKLTRKKLNNYVQQFATEGYTLDLGAGEKPYGEFFPQSISVDNNPDMNPDIVCDMHDMSNHFNDNTFDCILCTEVLEHTLWPHKLIVEMNRVLKSGGIIIVSTRFMYPIHDAPNDYFRYTEFALRRLFEEFEIMDFIPEASICESLGIIHQRVAFQTQVLGGWLNLPLFLWAELKARGICFIGKQFGDLRKSYPVESILTSGYYFVARKV